MSEIEETTIIPKKIAFVVGIFPAISETFIINQVADLVDRGVVVDVFTFEKGATKQVSERYHTYNMDDRVHEITVPKTKLMRAVKATIIAMRLLFSQPSTLVRVLRNEQYSPVRVLLWLEPFIAPTYDLVHCHMGRVAARYAVVHEVLQKKEKIVTTFYGYDVSHIPKMKGMNCYAHLIKHCSLFLVMSENMKSRVLPLGVPEEKIRVHPISIDVESYPFKERMYKEGDTIQIISVGRFVEKKGFDDLLRAIAIVKEKSDTPFVCKIVGDGELKEELYALTEELAVSDVVDFKGYMKLEDVLKLYEDSHLYVQASKTASNGDME